LDTAKKPLISINSLDVFPVFNKLTQNIFLSLSTTCVIMNVNMLITWEASEKFRVCVICRSRWRF